MNKLALAIAITAEAFKDKTDKAGKPYILHCLRVMNAVDQKDEELMQIAVLHDLIEDTGNTIHNLHVWGFSQRVIDGVAALTHLPRFGCEVSYDDYIKRIALNPDAKAVKLADLKDNSDITRLKGLRKKDHDRIEKYHRAYTYLSD